MPRQGTLGVYRDGLTVDLRKPLALATVTLDAIERGAKSGGKAIVGSKLG